MSYTHEFFENAKKVFSESPSTEINGQRWYTRVFKHENGSCEVKMDVGLSRTMRLFYNPTNVVTIECSHPVGNEIFAPLLAMTRYRLGNWPSEPMGLYQLDGDSGLKLQPSERMSPLTIYGTWEAAFVNKQRAHTELVRVLTDNHTLLVNGTVFMQTDSSRLSPNFSRFFYEIYGDGHKSTIMNRKLCSLRDAILLPERIFSEMSSFEV